MIEKKERGQRERFKEAARELGCDDSEERFNANLKRIAKAKSAKPTKDAKDGK